MTSSRMLSRDCLADHPSVILFSDYEADAVSLFTRQFRRDVRAGCYELPCAGNGAVLQDVVGSRPEIGLIIAAIYMPDMNGVGNCCRFSGC